MARIAFACLTAITVAAAAPALAQTAADPAAPVAPAAAPAAAAPAPEAPAAPAPPPLPTEGVVTQVFKVLDNACLPLIRTPGSDPKSVTKPLGLKDTRDGWQLKAGGVNKLNVRLPNSANPSSCEIILNYDPGQGPAIISGLAAWGANQPAPLSQVRAAENVPSPDPAIVLTNTNWVGWSASTRMGLSFLEQKKTDGTPVAKNADQAVVQFSFRAITAQDSVAQ